MLHQMNLNPDPFTLIESGRKTIELRLYDKKRQQIGVGDTILFTCTDNPARTLTVMVTALHRFPDFAALYAALPLEQCGYLPEELATAHPDDMSLYYTAEQQACYGVVGIEIQVLCKE